MRKLRFYLLLAGAIFTLTGWFFEKATPNFRLLQRRIYPEYILSVKVLHKLKENEKSAADIKHPGCQVLLKPWPELKEKDLVARIARSAECMEFGSVVEPDFQLIARGKNGEETNPRWTDSSARALLQRRFKWKQFWMETFTFHIGFFVVFVFGLLESLGKNEIAGKI